MENTQVLREVRLEQGFQTYFLRNEDVEVAVVPELGARVVSLKNLRTGREWLWHPDGGLKLFRNQTGDDFTRSTLAGVDECLPTIAACSWNGRNLPDHGEVWSAAWAVADEAWNRGVLKTAVELPVSPFAFVRSLEVQGNQLSLRYHLTNRGKAAENFLWALHPLLRLRPGDRLNLEPETRSLVNGEAWLDAVGSTIPRGGCAKLFATPLRSGLAEIVDKRSGERLRFEWNPAENNTLGLWLTRGGWSGHHHFALEPANAASDSLAQAAEQRHCGRVPALGSVSWSVRISVLTQ